MLLRFCDMHRLGVDCYAEPTTHVILAPPFELGKEPLARAA